jgi:hypothetical protein
MREEMVNMAIPYPSEIFGPYVAEPIGDFLSAWGPPVLFPIATWVLLIVLLALFVVMARAVWLDISTGGPLNRSQREQELAHAKMEANRQFLNPVGENQQRK